MSRKADQTVLYPKLLDAFREDPGNINAAANKCGVKWSTADRAWRLGARAYNYPPIKLVIAEEQEKARALLEADRLAKIAERRREIEAASENAIKARKQEGQMVALTRGQSLGALTAVTVLSGEARALAEAVKGQLQVERQKLIEWTAYETALVAGDPTATPPAWASSKNKGTGVRSLEAILSILQKSAQYATQITHCARQAMEMERLHLGEPIQTVKHELEIRGDMTLEEVRTRKENALRAIERAESAGGLKLLPGGKDTPTVGQRVVVR